MYRVCLSLHERLLKITLSITLIVQDSDDEDAGPQEESERAKHKQRELFLSRQIETLPATLIRGKCSVTLLSEVEEVSSYLKRDDAFFYSLVYDPHQKTLLADRGSIRLAQNVCDKKLCYSNFLRFNFLKLRYNARVIRIFSVSFINKLILSRMVFLKYLKMKILN